MPREKELMHDHLSALYERFGRETVMISLRQAAAYIHKDARTLEACRDFPVKRIGKQSFVPLINLARWLA